jgi:hypothetical protein
MVQEGSVSLLSAVNRNRRKRKERKNEMRNRELMTIYVWGQWTRCRKDEESHPSTSVVPGIVSASVMPRASTF